MNTKHTDSVEVIVDKLPYHKENTDGTVSNVRYYERSVVIKALTTLQATQSQQVEEAVRKERERIAKELCISWDNSIDNGTTWDLGNALIVVKVPLTPNHQD